MENNIWYSNCWTNEVDTHNNTGQTYGGSRSNMLHFCIKITHHLCQLHPYMNVTMHKKLSLFKNINQTTQNRKGRSARHRTSECIHLSLAQWLCSLSLLAGAGGGEEAEQRIENNSRQRDGRIHHPDAPVAEHSKTKYYTNTFLSLLYRCQLSTLSAH